MELEFRDSFLKDVKRIKEIAVKKKIAAVISDAQIATSLLDLKTSKNWKAVTLITESELGIIELELNCRIRL